MSEYSPEQLAEALQNMEQNIMEMHSQAVVSTIRDKCFNLCLSSAGSSLSTKDKTCIKNCSDRYLDTMNLVAKTLTSQTH